LLVLQFLFYTPESVVAPDSEEVAAEDIVPNPEEVAAEDVAPDSRSQRIGGRRT